MLPLPSTATPMGGCALVGTMLSVYVPAVSVSFNKPPEPGT